MNRTEYTETLLSQLRRVTPKEREAIRQEIDGHIEDHICSLLELGYDQKLAEERTMARMGDPVEAGRKLNQQYPVVWQVLTWLSALVLACMALFILFGAPDEDRSLMEALDNRAEAGQHIFLNQNPRFTQEPLDISFTVGDDTVRLQAISIGSGHFRELQEDGSYDWTYRERMASVYADAYDRFPCGPAGRIELILENERGKQGTELLTRSRWWKDGSVQVPIGLKDTHVTLICKRFGEEIRFQLPLPKEDVP